MNPRALHYIVAASLFAATAAAQPRKSGIAGVIRDSLGAPVRSARIFVPTAEVPATTDDSGRFDLRGLAGGAHDVTITRIGFLPVSFTATLPDDSVIVIAVMMHRVQMLDTMRVSAAVINARLARTGFLERQKEGFGSFFPPARLDSLAAHVMDPSGFLREARGIGFRCNRRGCMPVPKNASCMSLYVDGAYSGPAELLDSLGFSPGAIAALEVYDVPGTVPVEFQRARTSCAAVVVWTKVHVPRN